MKIVGLTYDSQPGWSGLVLRASDVILATFAKTRIGSLSTGRSLSSSCGRTKSALVTATKRNPTGELGYRVMADDVAALVGVLGLRKPLVLGYSDGGQISLELGMRYPGLAGALVLGGTQFRFSGAYLEDARALLGITDGEEVDTGKLEREQPDFVAYLREAHGHVYGPEYWKAYVKRLASLWLTPLRYTSEDLAAVTDAVLLLVGDRDGVCTEGSAELFHLLPNAELAVAPGSDHGFIEAKANLFDALALDFLFRHRDDPARVSE